LTSAVPTPAAPTLSPSAAAAPRDNQQTTMTQHYGVSAGPKMNPLPSGWMQLTVAATNRPVYFHKATSQLAFSRADMFLKSLPPVTPSPASRNSLSPATVQSFEPPDGVVSAPFPPTHREDTEGTNKEEAIELLFSSSSSSSSSSVDSELTISQTQKLKKRKISAQPVIRRTIPIRRLRVSKVRTLTHHSCIHLSEKEKKKKD
jgi:hypothetical protein